MRATQVKSKATPQKRQKTAKPTTKKAQSAPKPKRTNKPLVPTKEQRQIVMLASACGYSEARIAELVINPDTQKPITVKTLREHFANELDHGRETILMSIAGTMVSVATDKKHPKCITAGIFLAKVWGRMREPEPEWSERKRIAEQQAAEDEDGDLIIEAEIILEEKKPETPALPAPPTIQ